jgi:hypothetical protein
MVLWNKGKLDEAVAAFREVIRLEPRFPDAGARLREVLRMQGRLDDLIPGLREQFRASPRSAGVHYQLRVAEFRSDPREGERVRSDRERVLLGEPGNQDLWFGYPELCLYLRREDTYRRARATLLGRFGPGAAPQPAQRIAIACLLLPAEGDDLMRAADLAERGLAVDSTDRRTVSSGFACSPRGSPSTARVGTRARSIG